MSIEQRIWEFLPKRRTRNRVTNAVVIAVNLDLDTNEVQAALITMERHGHVVAERRGSWHRGIPIKEDQ